MQSNEYALRSNPPNSHGLSSRRSITRPPAAVLSAADSRQPGALTTAPGFSRSSGRPPRGQPSADTGQPGHTRSGSRGFQRSLRPTYRRQEARECDRSWSLCTPWRRPVFLDVLLHELVHWHGLPVSVRKRWRREWILHLRVSRGWRWILVRGCRVQRMRAWHGLLEQMRVVRKEPLGVLELGSHALDIGNPRREPIIAYDLAAPEKLVSDCVETAHSAPADATRI